MKTTTEIFSAACNIRTEVMAKFPEHRMLLMNVPIVVSRRLSRTLGQVKFRGTLNADMVSRTWTPIRLELSYAAFKHEANWAEMRDTVLHEICHIIAGRKAQHNSVWVSWANKLGCKPSACGNVPVSPVKPRQFVEIACNSCGKPLIATTRQAAKARNGTAFYRHAGCRPSAAIFDFKRPFCI